MSYTPPPRPTHAWWAVLIKDRDGKLREHVVRTTGEAAARLAAMRREDVPASNIIESHRRTP